MASWSTSAATDFTELVDPATGKVTGRSPKSTPQEVDEAVQAAATAFEEWKRTTPSQRQQALLKLADAIEEHADELVELQSRNTGQIKTLIHSEEVKVGADQLRGSSPVRHGTWRARPPGSTWRASPPRSAASRSGWSPR